MSRTGPLLMFVVVAILILAHTCLAEAWIEEVTESGVSIPPQNSRDYTQEWMLGGNNLTLSLDASAPLDVLVLTQEDYYSYLANRTYTYDEDHTRLNTSQENYTIRLPFGTGQWYVVLDNTPKPLEGVFENLEVEVTEITIHLIEIHSDNVNRDETTYWILAVLLIIVIPVSVGFFVAYRAGRGEPRHRHGRLSERCTRCGTPHEEGQDFCYSCGQYLGDG